MSATTSTRGSTARSGSRRSTNRHATVTSGTIRFRFRGKGGRTEERTLVDRRLATVVRRCRELSGQDLFEYVDDQGRTRPITSDDVNAYVREAAGADEFSAKDFRTWIATVLAYRALRGAAPVREAIRETAEALNDTETVTRNSYVHPAVLAAFEQEQGEMPRPGAVEVSPDRRRARDLDIDRREELAVLSILRKARRGDRAG